MGFFFFFFFGGGLAPPSPASPSPASPASPSALRFSPTAGEPSAAAVSIGSAPPSAPPSAPFPSAPSSAPFGAGGWYGVLVSATPPPSLRGGGASTTLTSCSHSRVPSLSLTCLVSMGTKGLDHASTSLKSALRLAHASSSVSPSAV